MKGLSATLWIVCLLIPILFYGMAWRPNWAYLESQTKALEDARAQRDQLSDDAKQLTPLREALAEKVSELKTRVGLKRISEAGLEELQASVKPPLRASDWASRTGTSPEGEPAATFVLAMTVAGPSPAVLRWVSQVTSHRRGFVVFHCDLRRQGSRLEGTLELVACKLPPL